ncbi:Tetraspanin-11 [Chelonia mydas]|uniref:Tetraspanin n=1 Tax=Chelonia mydas TaxID=8469 RepID=M7BUX1_CHEMY|nr:Tetraspanin-11 [Chelonia mydas]
MAVGIWTLAEKSDYISLLSSNTYMATAYILVVAGIVVMITGILGCCATFKERRNLLRVDICVSRAVFLFRSQPDSLRDATVIQALVIPQLLLWVPGLQPVDFDSFTIVLQYFILLLCIFLLEIIAGILAYIYYQQLSMELKQNLKETMTQKYRKEGEEGVTSAVDKLQQEFKCCGSNNATDWSESIWIKSPEAGGRKFPDSCCKTITEGCGRRDHPSNIYKEGGCITKLENFIQEHLKIIGAVGIGIACVQIFGMIFTCCLYKSLKSEPY